MTFFILKLRTSSYGTHQVTIVEYNIKYSRNIRLLSTQINETLNDCLHFDITYLFVWNINDYLTTTLGSILPDNYQLMFFSFFSLEIDLRRKGTPINEKWNDLLYLKITYLFAF